MRLLVVTDHKYFQGPDGVYDTYCFDRAFFDDYRAVFEDVRVAARVRSDPMPDTARRSDGDGVSFVPLPDLGGVRHIVASGSAYGPILRVALAEADAVCVRIPAMSGQVAAALARKLGKPVMFEMIGDPSAAMQASSHGFLASLVGRWQAGVVRKLVRHAVSGSYVSRRHLQKRYPPGPQTVHDSISSIRLPAETLQPAKEFSAPPEPLKVVLVASFVPIKCHDVLLRGVAHAIGQGAPVHLRLLGDGALRPAMEQLAAELGIAEAVTFFGHVSDRELLTRTLDESDVFAMTSASEGMPRSIIEAMARGLPAVGTNAGGIAELVAPEALFPVGDPARLGQILTELQRDPERLSELARYSEATAREFVEEVLSQRRRRLLGVLREQAEKGAVA
jgi:glycosyltransferase involved in cell wall biosynthesis